jgi:hypothetical protein
MAASRSSNLYYCLMHWRNVGAPSRFGGYWVSLNRFNVDSQKEDILVDQQTLDQMTNTERSWISGIVHISPDEKEIDVLAGVSVPAGDSEERMNYGVYRINLERKSVATRMLLPAVFV